MVKTCGIALFNKFNELLVCHPTGSSWNVWSIPKGINEFNETLVETAIREFKEETGIDLKKYEKEIIHIGSFEYKNKKKCLEGFFLKVDENYSVLDMDCDSFFTLNGKKYKEVDSYSWMDLLSDDFRNVLHLTQKLLIFGILFRSYSCNDRETSQVICYPEQFDDCNCINGIPKTIGGYNIDDIK